MGDELGFEQSLTNLDTSRRRSVSIKNGAPMNVVTGTSERPSAKQEVKFIINVLLIKQTSFSNIKI